MPTPTYTPLANLTLSSTQDTVTFTSISQSYKDLILIIQRKTTDVGNITLQVNSDTGSNYSRVSMYGDGTNTNSSNGTSTYFVVENVVSSNATDSVITKLDFMDYSATDKHKSVLVRAGRAGLGTETFAERWANTAAITSISINAIGSPLFSIGSSFSLFGIAS